MLSLSAHRVRELLEELGVRLAQRGIRADLYLLGGAAIALAFDERRVTDDIDAVFTDKAVVYEVAVQMATDLDLDRGWLNDAVKGFVLADDLKPSLVLDVPGLRVSAASPEILFAMKCLARRPEDREDVVLLANVLGIADGTAALGAVERIAGANRITAQVQFFVFGAFE